MSVGRAVPGTGFVSRNFPTMRQRHSESSVSIPRPPGSTLSSIRSSYEAPCSQGKLARLGKNLQQIKTGLFCAPWELLDREQSQHGMHQMEASYELLEEQTKHRSGPDTSQQIYTHLLI